MIALVYSGSRFAEWKLADKGMVIAEFKTSGINPIFIDQKHLLQILNKKTELINNAEKIKRIYFYGAGVNIDGRKDLVYNTLSLFFKYSKIYVYNDLQAAAMATCSENPGIAGIIGSGSSAGYFDGKKIKDNNYGLGYILGDEGSANWLGRQILKDFLYDTLPQDFKGKFLKRYDTNRKEILDRVYKQHQPTLYLSSFVDFLMDNNEEPYVKELVLKGFNLYYHTYIFPLQEQNPGVPIYIVGTVAYNFKAWLQEAAQKNDLHLSTIIKRPLHNLLQYYVNKTF